jgi:Domain of unknown function (DUF4439)
LTGCGIRLERDAPDLPGLKTQEPPPDQAALLAMLRSVQGLLRSADRTPDGANAWVLPVRIAHQAQVTRLVDVLASLGVDVPSAAGSASPSPTPTGTPSTSAAPSSPSPASTTSTGTPAAGGATGPLATAEVTFPGAATEQKAWAASDGNRPMLVSLCASRRAAASLLVGGDAPRPLAPGIPPASVSSIPIAQAIRPAVYGFELIAAKTPLRERAQVTDTLHWLGGARDALSAVVGEPEHTSYALPVRVTDAASARRLARALLADVLAAVASQTDAIGSQGWGPQRWTLRLWSNAAADHARWGAPVAAFPGLRT